MTRAQLVRLLREHRLAVVSTVAGHGAPQSTVVGCAVSDDLEVVFDTLESTRKAANLRRDPRISAVIGWGRETTAQIEGLHVRIRPHWIRWSDFVQRPPFIFESKVARLA